MSKTESSQTASSGMKPESVALARLDPQALIQAAVEHGSGIETLERLVALAKDVRAQQAKEAWLSAMAEFQRTCPQIKRSRKANIPTRGGGSYSYSYAPLAEIISKIQPVMGPLGLSVSFRVHHEKDQVIAICQVAHELGHSEGSGEVAMPVTQGDTGANPAQRVGIASTYAKRYALLAILGIAPEDDTDAHGAGEQVVTMPQRASAPQEPVAKKPANVWTGKVLNVKAKSGKTGDRDWTLYTIQTKDAQEFSSFSKTHADFASEAGSSPVRIEWEKTDKGSQKILAIGPPEDEDADV